MALSIPSLTIGNDNLSIRLLVDNCDINVSPSNTEQPPIVYLKLVIAASRCCYTELTVAFESDCPICWALR